jgi:hypothetical protein
MSTEQADAIDYYSSAARPEFIRYSRFLNPIAT